MSDPSGASCEAGTARCITCGDEGLAMRVLEVDRAGAVCADEDGDVHSVAIDLVDGVTEGATVLVHAGVAIWVAQ